MKVVAFNGSPRKGGNTHIAIQTVFDELGKKDIETEEVWLYDNKINGCTACYTCINTKDCKCTQKDDFNTLFSKVYGIDPLICKLCGSPMRIVAFIIDPEQVNKILRHLIKTGKSPPGLDPSSLN